jgi:hypothetical protein
MGWKPMPRKTAQSTTPFAAKFLIFAQKLHVVAVKWCVSIDSPQVTHNAEF